MTMSRRTFVTAASLLATTAATARWRTASAQSPKTNGGTRGDLSYRTVGELRAMLDARQVSAVELFDHAVARIEARDPRINAIVVRDFERARASAARADDALSRGERRPLLGIPMTVKESFNIGGLPTTWGIPAFKGWQASADATVVARLKTAGAVILGKSNLPLAISDWQSFNDIYGTTNNPWDLSRTPGGSSGGAAAALAAGLVALEIGSDINGSIRQPAHCCGVFGHKPSTGLVPLGGHVPPRADPAGSDATVGLGVAGPMARSAADLALAFGVIAGPEDRESIAWRLSLPSARHDRLRDFRVLMIDAHPLLPTALPIQSAMNKLAKRLHEMGTKISRSSPLLPDLAEAARLHQKLVFAFSQAFGPPDFYRRTEAAVAALAEGDNSLSAWRLRATIMSHRDWITANSARGRLREQWQSLFREWDVVLCPAAATPAFTHDHNPDQNSRVIEIDGKTYPYRDQSVWPGIATTPGLPATVAPIDKTDDGLPIGIQIVGPYLDDYTTIQFAVLLEREFGGFVIPPNSL